MKLQVLGLQIYIKKETLEQVFSYELCEIFKNSVFAEHLWDCFSSCPSLPLPSAQEQLNINLHLFIQCVYLVFLMAAHVITRLLLFC